MPLFFDIIIFGFLLVDAAVIFFLLRNGPAVLPKALSQVLALCAILAFAVIAYGSFIAPKRLVVRSESIALTSETTNVLHAALISDIHVGPYKGKTYVQQIVETINEINPDVVLLAGDFIEHDADQAEALAPLGNIAHVYPIYAVLGNHDYQLGSDSDPTDTETGQDVTAHLSLLGIHVLDNAGTSLKDGTIWLAGIDEIWADQADLPAALADRKSDVRATILLAHNPDIIQAISPEENINLVLAGHTHGGQIRLPWIGAVPRLPTELGKEYDRGLFRVGETQLFITSGTGESGPRARLFNPPEIVVLTIEY